MKHESLYKKDSLTGNSTEPEFISFQFPAYEKFSQSDQILQKVNILPKDLPGIELMSILLMNFSSN